LHLKTNIYLFKSFIRLCLRVLQKPPNRTNRTLVKTPVKKNANRTKLTLEKRRINCKAHGAKRAYQM